MIHRDYIMRLIEQMVAVLARVLFNKQIHNYDQALHDIDKALQSMFGWGSDFTTTLTATDLLAHLENVEGQYWEKCLVAAELINEEAQVFALKNGHSPMITDLYYKAFLFYFKAVQNAQDYDVNSFLHKLDYLANTLTQDDLPDTMKQELCDYYEWCGNYARAEDIYYELLELDRDAAIPLLTAFYTRLLAKSDEQLQAGNLPRNEVQDGMNEIKRL